jgi:hypothetical protein
VRPNSGLPGFGNIIIQVGNSRLGCANPKSRVGHLCIPGLRASHASRNDIGEYIPDNSLRQLRFADPAMIGTMISLNEPSRGPLHDMLRVGKQGEQA